MFAPVLSIVIPCYREEEVLPSTARVLEKLLQDMAGEGLVSPKSFVCFVNDGSCDRPWELIQEETAKSPLLSGINLSRNFGH